MRLSYFPFPTFSPITKILHPSSAVPNGGPGMGSSNGQSERNGLSIHFENTPEVKLHKNQHNLPISRKTY